MLFDNNLFYLFIFFNILFCGIILLDILGNAYLSSFFLAGQNSADLKQSMIAYTRAVCINLLYISYTIVL